jgi:hypothetical protein
MNDPPSTPLEKDRGWVGAYPPPGPRSAKFHALVLFAVDFGSRSATDNQQPQAPSEHAYWFPYIKGLGNGRTALGAALIVAGNRRIARKCLRRHTSLFKILIAN